MINFEKLVSGNRFENGLLPRDNRADDKDLSLSDFSRLFGNIFETQAALRRLVETARGNDFLSDSESSSLRINIGSTYPLDNPIEPPSAPHRSSVHTEGDGQYTIDMDMKNNRMYFSLDLQNNRAAVRMYILTRWLSDIGIEVEDAETGDVCMLSESIVSPHSQGRFYPTTPNILSNGNPNLISQQISGAQIKDEKIAAEGGLITNIDQTTRLLRGFSRDLDRFRTIIIQQSH